MKYLVSLLFIICHTAYAQCDEASDECAPIGEWEFSIALGVGQLTNPLNGGEDIPLVLIPNFSYYGEKIFIDNNALGYTLYENNAISFSVISQLNRESSFFQRWHPNNIFISTIADGALLSPGVIDDPVTGGEVSVPDNVVDGEPVSDAEPPIGGDISSPENVTDAEPPTEENISPPEDVPDETPPTEEDASPPDTSPPDTSPPDMVTDSEGEKAQDITLDNIKARKWAIDAGIQVNWFINRRTQLKAILVHDVNNVYSGFNGLIEADHLFVVPGIKNNIFTVTAGVYWQSKNQVDYYYGLSEQDGVTEEYYYQGSAATNPYLKLNSHYMINKDWTFKVSIKREWLGSSVKYSPLVKDDVIDTFFVGVEYAF